MSIEEKTLQQYKDETLANKETRLSTTAPTSPKSFLRVESVVQAGSLKGLEKRAVYAQRETLAITAGEDGLTEIAREYGISPRIPATKFVGVFRVTATAGSTVDAGAELTSDDTGAYYYVNSNASESGGFVEITVTAQSAGEAANITSGYLTFTSSNGRSAGTQAFAAYLSTTTTAEDQESISDFRRRVLAAERKTSGGGNESDYRDWSEAVSGVARAYPYSGKPVTFAIINNDEISFIASDSSINSSGQWGFLDPDSPLGVIYVGDMLQVEGSTYNNRTFTVVTVAAAKITVTETVVDEAAGGSVTLRNASQPGDITVYIASDALDVDGNPIPTSSLLDSVREEILIDPDTGLSRPGVGDIDSSLYVEPISVIEFGIYLFGLEVDASHEDDCKAAVVDDLGTYFSTMEPFIEGLDFEMDRNDRATTVSASKVIQGALNAYGASVQSISLELSGETVTEWILGQGVRAKLDETNVNWEEV